VEHRTKKFSRRQLGKAALAGGAAASFLNSPQILNAQMPAKTPEVLPFGETINFTRKAAPKRVAAFSMEQVRITDGPYKQASDVNLAYLQRLDVDRLVHNFRVNAGLPSFAKPLGGWEAPDCELRGHFVGHFLSACALANASTGDQAIKQKGTAVVAALAECQQKLGGGYLSAFPTEFFDRVKVRQKVWAPFYTYHKIMAGMLDMSQLSGNQQALDVVKGMALWVDNWTSPIPEPQMQNILGEEYGGMNEVLYNLALVTGDDRYAVVGDRFTKKWFFNPLALRRDELRGLHVNTHIPQVIGAARRYELSSDERFHDVADFFWYEVTSARAYATGGTSNGERWLVEPRRLGAELKMDVSTTECCCAYNMLKLTRSLYEWTADPRYFDYYERVLWNHRLGSMETSTGHTGYYYSIHPGGWKTFCSENDSFWCCTGTGVEEFGKLNDSIYFHDTDGVYVNLFVPSVLNWTEKGLTLRQETNFPEQPGTSLHLGALRATELSLHLRIPQWANSASVRVNGQPVDAIASAGSYLTIKRTWKDGDRIQLDLPMNLHLETMPDEPNTQAILYGPLVLAGGLGVAGLSPQVIEGKEGPDPKDMDVAIPRLHATTANPDSWIKKQGDSLRFSTIGQEKDIEFEPLYRVFGKRYSIYWTVA
jgi:DUF1680 family protein